MIIVVNVAEGLADRFESCASRAESPRYFGPYQATASGVLTGNAGQGGMSREVAKGSTGVDRDLSLPGYLGSHMRT